MVEAFCFCGEISTEPWLERMFGFFGLILISSATSRGLEAEAEPCSWPPPCRASDISVVANAIGKGVVDDCCAKDSVSLVEKRQQNKSRSLWWMEGRGEGKTSQTSR